MQSTAVATMSSTTSQFPKGKQKTCILCGALMPEAAVKCTVCDGFQDSPTKTCVVCGSLMPINASKCKTCSSSQGWTRYLPLGTTTLALLTALVSVVASTTPTFIRWVKGDNSDIRTNFARDDHSGGIILTVSNYGDRPGSIKDITLNIPFKQPNGRPTSYRGTVDTTDPKFDEYFVAPGDNRSIRVKFLDVNFDATNFSSADFSGPCSIVVATSEYSNQKDPTTLSQPCERLSVVIGLHKQN